LRRTRDFLLKNKENKGKMSHIQNPDQFINMIDQAIKFWHTPQRNKVLDKLVAIEDKLAENGFIKYDIDGIEGIEDWDDDEPGTAGLGRSKKRKGRFFSAIKKIGKKVGSVAKKAVKAIVRFNPLSIAIRNGLLAALRLNMFGIAKKLQYAYLPDNLASKYNIDPAKLADLKKRHAKVKKLFNGLQGKEKNLRNAILKGAKQKSPDFSINGIEGIIAGLKGLDAIGALAQLGDLGVAATAASVGAATGVLAKIKSWLKPVSNIFTKAKEKIAARKQARQQAAQQQNSTDTNQDMEQNLTPMTPIAPSVNYSIPNTNSESSSPPYLPLPTPTNMARTPTTLNPQKGISKGAKVGIGLGLAALIGTGAYFMFRNKGHKPKTTNRTMESPEKKSLGRIELS
jgi:hypothetical protein